MLKLKALGLQCVAGLRLRLAQVVISHTDTKYVAQILEKGATARILEIHEKKEVRVNVEAYY